MATVLLTSDESKLIHYIKNSSDTYLRVMALSKIEDEFVLVDIARNDSDEYVRELTNGRLKKLGYR